MSLFQEYLNSKKQNPKPVVDALGDRTDPMTPPNKPPKGGPAYKCSDGKPKKASEKGFAHMGDQKLKYNPDVKNPHGKSPAKIPTVEQIAWTSKMAEAMLRDPTLIEQMVRQMKQRGLLGPLVAEVFDHKESAGHLASIINNETYGPKVTRNLNRAMNEEVAGPFADELEGQDKDDDLENEDGKEGDEGEDELDPDEEDSEGDGANADPMMGGMDPSMDPSMGGMDPSMGGMDPMMGGGDPSMGGGMPPMDPSMMGGMPPMGQPGMPQMPPQMPPQMAKFQRSLMRAYQRAMMGKK